MAVNWGQHCHMSTFVLEVENGRYIPLPVKIMFDAALTIADLLLRTITDVTFLTMAYSSMDRF